MDQPIKIATAVFLIEDHPEMGECQADIVHWRGATWLVANRFLEIATGKQIPAELVPLQLLAPLSQEDGLVRLAMKVPIELSPYPCPQTLRIALQVVDVLATAHIQGPTSIQ